MDGPPFPLGYSFTDKGPSPQFAGEEGAPLFDERFIEELDAELMKHCNALANPKADLISIHSAIQSLCDALTHRTTDAQQLGVEPNRLLVPGWREHWKCNREVQWVLFSSLVDRGALSPEAAEHLHRVFVQMVRFVCEGMTEPIRRAIGRELVGALDWYLSFRGHDIQSANDGSGENRNDTDDDSSVESQLIDNGVSTKDALISVDSWDDLAIGIDEDGGYLAVTPVPEFNEVFPKESTVPLPLTGNRWRKLLDLFANSEDGRTARKDDLFYAFGYLSQRVNEEDINEIRRDSGAVSEVKSATTKLTQAIGDLSRELRELVSAANDLKRKNPPLTVSDSAHVRSGFTCRYLLRDDRGKLRFGGS